MLKDKLAALYETMQNIIFQKSEYSLLSTHFHHLIHYAKDIALKLKETDAVCYDLISTKDELTGSASQLLEIIKDLESQKKYSMSLNKTKNTRMKEIVESLTEERDKLKASLEIGESNFKILTEEYEKLRKRSKQIKFRVSEKEDEKICKNCNKFFKEEENFN